MTLPPYAHAELVLRCWSCGVAVNKGMSELDTL